MNLTKELILEELDNRNLKYGKYETELIEDYLLNLYELNLLPENVTYKDLIAKLEKYNVSIVFLMKTMKLIKNGEMNLKGILIHKIMGM